MQITSRKDEVSKDEWISRFNNLRRSHIHIWNLKNHLDELCVSLSADNHRLMAENEELKSRSSMPQSEDLIVNAVARLKAQGYVNEQGLITKLGRSSVRESNIKPITHSNPIGAVNPFEVWSTPTPTKAANE